MTDNESDVLKIIVRARWSQKMMFTGHIADELALSQTKVLGIIATLKLNGFVDHLGATEKAFGYTKTL